MSVLFGDLLSHSYNITFSMFLDLVFIGLDVIVTDQHANPVQSVLLFTDGNANIGITNEQSILAEVKKNQNRPASEHTPSRLPVIPLHRRFGDSHRNSSASVNVPQTNSAQLVPTSAQQSLCIPKTELHSKVCACSTPFRTAELNCCVAIFPHTQKPSWL